MKAFQIENQKLFMAHLFMKDTFQEFLLLEASFMTYCSFTIRGQRNTEFYDSNDGADVQYDCVGWEQVKGYCFSIIKGKILPLSMKITLKLKPSAYKAFLEKYGLEYRTSDIQSLLITIHYDRKSASVISGTNLSVFTMDKSLEQAWDKEITSLLALI